MPWKSPSRPRYNPWLPAARQERRSGVRPLWSILQKACYRPTLIYRFEAVRLAEVSGRKMVEVPYRPQHEVLARADARPRQQCPFVVEGACSVYADRPMICRLHHSLGDDPGRCLPLPSGEAQARWMYDPDHVEVPYHLLVRMMRPKEPWGPITEFYPPQAG